MAGATLDMYTSGNNAGQVKRPLVYTTTEDDATRVKIYLQLATPLGEYLLDTDEGLDHELILTTDSDEERAALVRDLVLADERVESIVEGPTVTVDADNITVAIAVTFKTITGTLVSIGT